nr:CHAT domain-containing protein [Actinomycetota bacterium]
DLGRRYLEAAARVRALEGTRDPEAAERPASGESARPQDVRAARLELQSVVDEIRSVPGHERFLCPPEFGDLAALASEHPAVYVTATAVGGLALVLTPDGEVAAHWLPRLDDRSLRERLVDYFRAYFEQEQAEGPWLEAIERITRWLWDAVMEEVVEATTPATRVVLVPSGWLGLLPLHAAWTEAGGGRRYVLDDRCVTYAPNLGSYGLATARAAAAASDGALVVEDPQPVSAIPLTYARIEARAVVAAFPEHRHLPGGKATHERVLAALGEHPVLHFACHGATDSEEPLDSALYMANDEPLTVRDFFEARLTGARLAVLSACESGMIGVELPDEVVGLPAALMQAGVPGVVGSLWPVSDVSTMSLMKRFYELWREEGKEPALALQDAQRKLREGDGEFAHPFHWAAFAYVGA